VNHHDHLPSAPETTHWDVVVVGTGMGGATAGYALAKQGKKVLFLEKGRFLLDDASDRGDGKIPTDADESPEGRLRRGWWPYELEGRTSFGDLSFFAPVGCVVGGTTALYAAQLERFDATDFRPRVNFPGARSANLPERWPFSYDDLVPYYRQAEKLFHVAGTPDPLNPDPEAQLVAPPALSERDRSIHDGFVDAGLHPYRAHVGFQFKPGCEECGGVMCPRTCKADVGSLCLVPALVDHGAKILPECEVLRFEASSSSVEGVVCRYQGREITVRGTRVLLAAGAFMSPALLLRSTSDAWPDGLANRSGAVGRNLMVHTSDFVAVRPPKKGSDVGPKKSIALNDFYFIDGQKLGTFQSVGVEVHWGAILHYLRLESAKDPTWWKKAAKPLLRPAALAGGQLFKNAATFSTIVEDLPYRDNRVLLDASSKNGMRFEYTYTDELKARNKLFRDRLKSSLKGMSLQFITGPNNLNYGHVCGTVRAGEDPATSVVDGRNKAHDLDNLYVVDSSFFPTSSGTNPSLTIGANALRVADAIAEEDA
jgi:choline dehydrogenase-like flavoprotein